MGKTEKPKLLILGKLPPPYIGPAIATEILLGSSLNQKYDVEFFSMKLSDNLNDMNRLHLKKGHRLIKNYILFINKLSKNKPEIALFPIGQTTVAFLRDSIYLIFLKLFKVKHLIQLRGSNFVNWYSKLSGIMKLWVRIILKTPSGAIVLGERLRYLFEEFYKEAKIFVVPNGGDFHYERAVTKKDRLQVLFLANLQPSKGIEDFVDAVLLLKREALDINCNVVGQWRDEKTKINCMSKVRDNDLPIQFSGVKRGNEKRDAFSNADIFIFPPREPEGHPWVIIEAMAAGLPIIATDQGAICESVKDGVNGFIVAPRNPGQIADRLKMLMKDLDLLMRMGIESKHLYDERFTERHMVGKLSEAINTILKLQ